MKRQEFIDAVVMQLIQPTTKHYGNNWKKSFDEAEALADERAKRYPFEGETSTPLLTLKGIGVITGEGTFFFEDEEREYINVGTSENPTCNEEDPYGVDWNNAPEWANYHSVDEDGLGWWCQNRPIIGVGSDGEGWIEPSADGLVEFAAKDYEPEHNPDWKGSLRKRPEK